MQSSAPHCAWLSGICAAALLAAGAARAAEKELAVGGARKPATLHVSKLGDGTDGRSWRTAFRTLQAALDAVPDEQGGHQILVRPDRYVEANLAPARKGAPGLYNSLVGDFDGRLGSGTSGWVVIDSGDPEKGFKSWDWWARFARRTSTGPPSCFPVWPLREARRS